MLFQYFKGNVQDLCLISFFVQQTLMIGAICEKKSPFQMLIQCGTNVQTY